MNVTKISSVEETLSELKTGDFVVIGSEPAIISLGEHRKGLRATYLSDGSFHEDFILGKHGSKKLPKGSTVSAIIK